MAWGEALWDESVELEWACVFLGGWGVYPSE